MPKTVYPVLGTPVDVLSYSQILQRIEYKIYSDEPRGVICVAAVHLIMESYHSPTLQAALQHAWLITADGMPLVLLQQKAGFHQAQRIYGPDLMLKICAIAARKKWRIYFLGGSLHESQQLTTVLQQKFPSLLVVGHCDTPHKRLSEKKNQKILAEIRQLQAQIVFVGLGCPYQEQWMLQHTADLPQSILIGVGAAFDFHTGKIKQAPHILQRLSLEWLFRLIQEPQRLWRRYLILNTQFILALFQVAVRQLIKSIHL